MRVALDTKIFAEFVKLLKTLIADKTVHFSVFKEMIAAVHHTTEPSDLAVLDQVGEVGGGTLTAELVVATKRYELRSVVILVANLTKNLVIVCWRYRFFTWTSGCYI